MSDRPRSTAARVRRTPALRIAARVGYAVNGLLNITIGSLALGVAGSGASGSASPRARCPDWPRRPAAWC